MDADIDDILRERFGLAEFRLKQRDVIADVLAGRDALCVMPTGAGKSLCYQLPAVAKGGLCVVVSPLISLMADQVRHMRARDVPAIYLNSSMSPAEMRGTLSEIEQGFDGLLYVAPERFVMPGFVALMRSRGVSMLAVDEAHCVSQWGHDFRPEYSRIGQVRADIGDPVTVALTATATDDVRADIIHLLHLREPSITITGFDRPNLKYESLRTRTYNDRDAALVSALRDVKQGSGIVYCSTRKAVDELVPMLREKLPGRTIAGYHAGMDVAERHRAQETFMYEDGAIAVATNAFGMGINKPDVRLVAHYNLPGTIEAYYQEAGRAGRDGDPARCLLLYFSRDRETQQFFIDNIGKGDDNADPRVIAELQKHAEQKLDLMVQYAAGHRCRRQMILDYFGDETEVDDCQCDVCSRGEGDLDADDGSPIDESTTLRVRQILSGIARMHRRFGVGAVADLLSGSDAARVRQYGWDQLPTYGVLRDQKRTVVRDWIEAVIESGLARQIDPDRNFKPVVELSPQGIAVMKGEKPPPRVLARQIATGTDEPAAASTKSSRSKRGSAAQADVVQLTGEAAERFDRLRTARATLAKEKDVPAYVICHDRTLKLIALTCPTDETQLGNVKGMGPMKVKMYGAALLGALYGDAGATEPRVVYDEPAVGEE
jgi:ATP-dependent DNA helicase RecQ